MTIPSELELLALNPTGQSNQTKTLNSTDTLQSPDSPTTRIMSNDSNHNKGVADSKHSEQDTMSRIATLEQRYIDLLEKRITSLEAGAQVTGFRPMEDKDYSEKIQPNNAEGTNESGKDRHGGAEDPKAGATDRVNGSISQTNPTEESPEPSRILTRECRWKDGYQTTKDVEPDQKQAATEVDENVECAFTWIRTYDANDKYERTDVEIRPGPLAEILRKNLPHYADFPVDDTMNFGSPFNCFVYNWTKLQAEAEGDGDKQSTASKDLKQLLEHISNTAELKPCFQDFHPAKKHKSINFQFLWTIFPPGCLIYSKPVMGEDQVLLLQYADEDKLDESGRKGLILTCWAYDWNGETFNRVAYELQIESFKDTKSINMLEHYPLEYHRDQEKVRSHLIKRGQKYRNLCVPESGVQLFDYDGISIEDQKGITRQDISSRFKGRVIIDFLSYNQYVQGGVRMGSAQLTEPFPVCDCPACDKNEALKKTTRSGYDGFKGDQEFSDEQFLLCPPRVLGFFMLKKTWAQLLVESVQDLEVNKSDAFEKLVLAEEQKTLIKSLVSRHGEDSTQNESGFQQVEDIIQGKGRGVVILLHGPPGVGKTLTAGECERLRARVSVIAKPHTESVAQTTNKPLFAVSVADVGLRPADVEVNLEQLFNLASLWKAVLLFDEADVFLEAREKNEMERNALVSVLLRVMEYYEGILILTTNRIKMFDVAVQSRVHLAVRYQDLSPTDRNKVFMNFYDQLTSENCSELMRLKEYIKEFDENFNGRQIRNVFSSALALAREHKRKVRVEDFKKVVKVTKEFQGYLQEQSYKARQKNE
ncbi:MAG: hypothetical protein Q9226_004928 [Calogaya cf. arnoldii]